MRKTILPAVLLLLAACAPSEPVAPVHQGAKAADPGTLISALAFLGALAVVA